MGSCRLCRGWHVFLQSPDKGDKFGVTINGPDDDVPINCANYTWYNKLADGDAKTMTTTRRPAALLTLSR
jgi:hypothetical protein